MILAGKAKIVNSYFSAYYFLVINYMANTRFNYDKCRTIKILQESTGPGRYLLNTPGPGCNPCFIEDPHIRLKKIGPNLRSVSNGHPVDIDSDLMGLTRPLTKDCLMYDTNAVKSTQKTYKDCSIDYTDESRATHPAFMYRDLEQDRWYPVFMDVNRPTSIPLNDYKNSVLQAKDNYKPHFRCPLD